MTWDFQDGNWQVGRRKRNLPQEMGHPRWELAGRVRRLVCMYVCLSVRMCVCVYVCMSACLYVGIYVCT